MEANKRIRLKIASPCSADWNSMKGDDAVRHCGSCKKSVYQLSNMSSAQVEALLAESGEEKCVRFYQRKDGTLLTQDCFVGLRRRRRKQAVVGAGMGVLSALGLAMSGGSPASTSKSDVPHVDEVVVPEQQVVPDRRAERAEPVTEPAAEPDSEQYELIMGGMTEMDYEDIRDAPPELQDEGSEE